MPSSANLPALLLAFDGKLPEYLSPMKIQSKSALVAGLVILSLAAAPPLRGEQVSADGNGAA